MNECNRHGMLDCVTSHQVQATVCLALNRNTSPGRWFTLITGTVTLPPVSEVSVSAIIVNSIYLDFNNS